MTEKRIPSLDFRDKKYNCNQCQVKVAAIHKNESSELHGYKLYCKICGNFVGWSGVKKEIIKDGTRQFSSQWSAKQVGINFCQICLRRKEDLGKSETLEPHHIIQIKDGGLDEISNIQFLCTACHKFVHYQRIYLKEHLKPQIEAFKAIQAVKKVNPNIYKQIVDIYQKEKANYAKSAS